MPPAFCLSKILSPLSPQVASQAISACHAERAGCAQVHVDRGCRGASDFRGQESPQGLCTLFYRANCAEPEAQALASGRIELAKCLAGARATADACMSP